MRSPNEVFFEFIEDELYSSPDKFIAELEAMGTDEAATFIDLIRAFDKINIGEPDAAIALGERAYAKLESTNDEATKSACKNVMGIANFYSGRYAEAYEHWLNAAAITEPLDMPARLGAIWMNIGNVFAGTGDTAKALEWYNKGKGEFEAANDLIGVAGVLCAIGSLAQDHGKVEDSIEPLLESIEAYKRAGVENGGALTQMNIALSYATMGKAKESQEHLDQITEEEKQNTIILLGHDLTKGRLLEFEDKIDAAVEVFEAGRKIAVDREYKEIEVYYLERLRDCALKQNDLQQYVHFNQLHQKVQGELRSTETAMRIATQQKDQEMALERVARDKERALLYGALPESVANRMLQGEDVSGDHFDNASVMFIDVAGFTTNSAALDARVVAELLDNIFEHFDDICARHAVTKIKTIGDAYLAVSLPDDSDQDHNIRTAKASLEILSSNLNWPDGTPLKFRIGVHSGPVVAGVIGKQRLQYDVWGDTVNVASRMESTGEPGKVHCSEAFADVILSSRSVSEGLTKRGEVDIKGKGTMTTYWLEGA